MSGKKATATKSVKPNKVPDLIKDVSMEPKKENAKRQQTGKIIGIHISSARTRRNMDKLTLNKTVEEEIAKFKADINAHDTAVQLLADGVRKKNEEYQEVVTVTNEDGTQVKEHVKKTREVSVPLSKEEITQLRNTVHTITPKLAELKGKVVALSRERVRFANEAPVATSIICDEFVQQFIEHAMKKVLASKKKIVQINHLHEAGIEHLSLYPLAKSLPSFMATTQMLADVARTAELDKLISAAKEQAWKEFKTQYKDVLPKKKKGASAPAAPIAAPATVVPDVVEEEDDAADSKTGFKFYVSQVCREVIKTNPSYAHVRISTDIRNYLSVLLTELIQRLSYLTQLTTEAMKIKTVNDVAILKTVEKLLVDGRTPTETISYRPEKVPDPEVVRVELKKKADAKLAGAVYKVNLDAIPKVDGWVAVRDVKYELSGFAELAAKVTEKIKIHREHNKEESA